MKGIEKQLTKVIEHVDTYPERRTQLEARLQKIEDIMKEGLPHPKASAQTVAMYGELREEIAEIRIVLFGRPETKEIGMVEKVNEMHTILVQAQGARNGAKSLLQWVILVGAAFTALAVIKSHWWTK